MAHLASSGASSLPQLVFLLFAGAVWLVKILNRSKAPPASRPPVQPGPEAADSGDPGVPLAQDSEAEERARRVREEILRKIAERHPSASVGELRGLVKAAYARREPVRGAAGPVPSTMQPAVIAPPAFAQAAPEAFSGNTLPVKSAGAVWLDELRSHDSARKAILVREILGPPIALR